MLTILSPLKAVQKQLQIKQSIHKAVGKAGKQLLSRNTEENHESLEKKLEDLEQKWSDISGLSNKRQLILERTQAELSKIAVINKHTKCFPTGQLNTSMQSLQNWFGTVNIALGHPVYGNKQTVENLITSHQVRKNYHICIGKRKFKCCGNSLCYVKFDSSCPEIYAFKLRAHLLYYILFFLHCLLHNFRKIAIT